MYYNGYGVTKDYKAALEWYKKAAEQGHAVAQNRLGAMYAKGDGVTQDYKEAFKWYRKAAEQGYALAQFNLGGMYLEGNGVTKDYVQSYMWFKLAVSGGYKDAVKILETLKSKMSPNQIEEALRLSKEFKVKKAR